RGVEERVGRDEAGDVPRGVAPAVGRRLVGQVDGEHLAGARRRLRVGDRLAAAAGGDDDLLLAGSAEGGENGRLIVEGRADGRLADVDHTAHAGAAGAAARAAGRAAVVGAGDRLAALAEARAELCVGLDGAAAGPPGRRTAGAAGGHR